MSVFWEISSLSIFPNSRNSNKIFVQNTDSSEKKTTIELQEAAKKHIYVPVKIENDLF